MIPEPTNLQKAIDFKLDLDAGKYTYLRYKEGGQEALRYGEKWRELSGDNLTYYMGCHIEELAKQLEVVQAELEQEQIWKEEDPRMLREQMRVHDVAFQHLFEQHKALQKENAELNGQLKHIAFTYCGIEIGKPLEGIDEPETNVSMVAAFVEGAIDEQAFRADKAGSERDSLTLALAEKVKENSKLREALMLMATIP